MKNQVAIVTGASSGIGEALAVQLLERGAKVVVSARRLEVLQEKFGHFGADDCLCVKTDVAVEEDCKALIAATISKFGKIDLLINNAGISMRADFCDTELDVLKRLMDVNFWGTVYCSRFAIQHLLDSGGTIVGVSSIAGYRGLPGRTGYSASKFAMQGFLESLRAEHINDKMNVLIACPGYTTSNIRNTALTAGGDEQGESPRNEQKMMSSEEVATRILRAVEKRKRSLVLTTQGKLTVLLNKLVPGFMDKMTYNHVQREKAYSVTK